MASKINGRKRLIQRYQQPVLEKMGALGNTSNLEPQPIPNVPDTIFEFCDRVRIVSGLHTVPYVPYGYQRELYKLLEERSIAVMKTRQLGITLGLAVYCLYDALKGYTSLWISRSGDDGKEVIKRLRQIIYGIPELRGYLASDNLMTLDFWDGSKQQVHGRIITRAPVGDSAARSLSNVRNIVFDEAQSIPEFETVYGAALPVTEAVGKDARIIVNGTPPEMAGGYYWNLLSSNQATDIESLCDRMADGIDDPLQMWTDKEGWGKVLIHWKAHPKHSQNANYLADTKRRFKLTESQLQREYNLRIPKQGASLFNRAKVDEQAIGAWAEPIPGRIYLCGIDPNFGGSDYFRCGIWDVTSAPFSLVAEYKASERSNSYNEDMTKALIRKYSPLVTGVENNSGGAVLIERFAKELPGQRFEGVNTNRTSKRVMTDRIAIAVEEGEVIYPADWDGVNEMKKFSARDREAISGHDDAVMMFAISWSQIDKAGHQYSESRAYW